MELIVEGKSWDQERERLTHPWDAEAEIEPTARKRLVELYESTSANGTFEDLAQDVTIVFTAEDGTSGVSIPSTNANSVTNLTGYDGEIYNGLTGGIKGKIKDFRRGPVVDSGSITIGDLLKEMESTGVEEGKLKQTEFAWRDRNFEISGSKPTLYKVGSQKSTFKVGEDNESVIEGVSSFPYRFKISPDSELAFEVRENEKGLLYEARLDVRIKTGLSGAPAIASIYEQEVSGKNY